MDVKARAMKILSILEKTYPHPHIALEFKDPLLLMVATILSAQCTDARVNMVTPGLFKKYPDVKAFANADLDELKKEIRSTGFYNNKAKNIKAAAQMIVKDFDGKVPNTMEDLLKLPGVARKTANIILSNAFGKVEGIAVDTHVGRLSQRLGFSKNKDPNKIEKDLMALFPHDQWYKINYLLIDHGRAICDARKPKCPDCSANRICPSAREYLNKYYG